MKLLLTISVFLLMLFNQGVRAESILKNFSQKASSSLLSFSYEFSTKGDLPLKGKGTALVQGRNFIIKGEGLEVRCDGSSRWTMDPVAKEAVAESVDETGRDYMTDPALLLASMEASFTELSCSKGRFQGKEADIIVLKPKTASQLKEAELYFEKGLPFFAKVTLKDGTIASFSLKDMKFLEKTDEARFSFDASSLDSSWVVTDLR